MSIEIKDYHPKYIPLQVNLGKELMDSWKFQNQSSEEHLKRVYGKGNFRSKYRIYAFEGDILVGFQTSDLVEENDQKVGRMEFPITAQEDVSDLLEEESEQRLIHDGANMLRVRVSPHWGRTEYFAKKYGFTFEKYHLMSAKTDIEELEDQQISTNYQVVTVDTGEKHANLFRDVFPKRFPMRYEEEVDEWMEYYADQNPLVWFILVDQNEQPIGHLIGFNREGNLAMTSLFSLGDEPAIKLQTLLVKAIEVAKKQNTISTVSLSIGDDQIPYAGEIQELGIDLQGEISYYKKQV